MEPQQQASSSLSSPLGDDDFNNNKIITSDKTTSELFIHSLMNSALHPTDMNNIQKHQVEVFKTMKQTNEDLQRVNNKCGSELQNIQKDFNIHQFMLKEMKSDLEFITKALADIRRKMGIKEPERNEDEVDLDDEVLTYSPVNPSKVQHVNADSLQEHSEYLEGDDMMHYVN